MSPAPPDPKVYHITHVDNLPGILADGGLWSDAAMIDRGGPAAPIGMSTIKQRRLGLPLTCHPGDHVGDYVPFYFCPRSIMLYLLYRANHPELTYLGGQGPVVHLQAGLRETVAWAEGEGRRWAFSLSNAGARYTEFRNRLEQLEEVDWSAVAATDFRAAQVKEGKQAEFLVYEHFPWHLVERMGVASIDIRDRITGMVAGSAHLPAVEVVPQWYF